MKYFGTDGFRGKANEVLTADHAFNIGKFLGWYFTDGAHKKASCVIGKDTRRSSYMLSLIHISENKVHLLLDYTDRPGAIADPWYTGNFEATYRDVCEGCEGFLNSLGK